MALYEITAEKIDRLSEGSFPESQVKEREDLQRLLRQDVEIVSPDTMVIAEEFGNWEDSRRRIDLLCLDKDARIVVAELKRTEDGGHMELQAIRYAAMVSTMTFDQVVEAHGHYLKQIESDRDARAAILDFLEWDEPNEEAFAQDVRMLLVSADFSRELTTAVMWLNERGLDITCVRLKPYTLEGRLLVDVQQVIPLPEAAEYQVKVREKERRKGARWEPKDLPAIWRMLEERCTEDEIGAAHEINDWLDPLVDEILPTSNSFAPFIQGERHKHFLFKVMVTGKLEMWFYHLCDRPPFNDEQLLKEALSRLNRVPGVHISEDRLRGKPKFPLAAVTDPKAMAQFKEAIKWMIERIRACDGQSV